jgi:hypothetical protein
MSSFTLGGSDVTRKSIHVAMNQTLTIKSSSHCCDRSYFGCSKLNSCSSRSFTPGAAQIQLFMTDIKFRQFSVVWLKSQIHWNVLPLIPHVPHPHNASSCHNTTEFYVPNIAKPLIMASLQRTLYEHALYLIITFATFIVINVVKEWFRQGVEKLALLRGP